MVNLWIKPYFYSRQSHKSDQHTSLRLCSFATLPHTRGLCKRFSHFSTRTHGIYLDYSIKNEYIRIQMN